MRAVWIGILTSGVACTTPAVAPNRVPPTKSPRPHPAPAPQTTSTTNDASPVMPAPSSTSDAGPPSTAPETAAAPSSVEPQTSTPPQPVDLPLFLARWNAQMHDAEYRLRRPAGGPPYTFAIGRLWCNLHIIVGRGGHIVQAKLEHTAKATARWSCDFAERAMLSAMLDSTEIASSLLRRVEVASDQKATRTVTTDALRVTRRNDSGAGSVEVAVLPR